MKYDISPFNAEQSQLVIESITLRYEFYKTMSPSAQAAYNAELPPPPVIIIEEPEVVATVTISIN